MIQVTAKQLGERLGVEYAVAANLVKVIVASGQGKEVGKVDMHGAKGKPAAIFELPEVFTLNLAAPAEKVA